MSATTEKVFVEALSLPTRERCTAADEGKITEREAADVLRDAYRKVK
jgi:hypothetical protein